jgi:hypothetical protein
MKNWCSCQNNSNGLQRVANMARSRSLAVCFLVTCMFMFLLICLNSTKAAMGYDLLLCHVISLFDIIYHYLCIVTN